MQFVQPSPHLCEIIWSKVFSFSWGYYWFIHFHSWVCDSFTDLHCEGVDLDFWSNFFSLWIFCCFAEPISFCLYLYWPTKQDSSCPFVRVDPRVMVMLQVCLLWNLEKQVLFISKLQHTTEEPASGIWRRTLCKCAECGCQGNLLQETETETNPKWFSTITFSKVSGIY